MKNRPSYEELEQRVRELEMTASQAAETEKALRESESFYKSFVTFAPYPIIVFTLDGRVSYLNDAFTAVFGWSLEEARKKDLSDFPKEWKTETEEEIARLLEDRVALRQETRRRTKDGRILDVVVRARGIPDSHEPPQAVLILLRDATQEKRANRVNEVMLRISMALPEHSELADLLYYINTEVKHILGTEGSNVILLDEARGDLFIVGAAYDDADAERKIREMRFPVDRLIAGRVIRSGKPIIVPDTSTDREIHEERDRR